VIPLGCNLHANMTAHVVVTSAPHYAITRPDGKFSFKSLEPGAYKLRVWNEGGAAPVAQEVVIKPDKNSVTVVARAGGARGKL